MTATVPLTMSAFMRPATLSCCFAVACLVPSEARAQHFVSERVQGSQRLCFYGEANGLLSGQVASRQHRVGLAENCPVTYPVVNGGQPAPPSAALRSDTIARESRICVYERWETTWTFSLPAQTACPPVAGMIPRNPAASTDGSGPAGR